MGIGGLVLFGEGREVFEAWRFGQFGGPLAAARSTAGTVIDASLRIVEADDGVDVAGDELGHAHIVNRE